MAAEEVRTVLGGPESGVVWVLRETWEAWEDRDVGRVKLAEPMEERCRAIDMSGGTFSPDPRECDVTRHLIEMLGMDGLAVRIEDPSVEEQEVR